MKFIDIIKEDESESERKKFIKKVKKIMNFYEEGEYTYKTPYGDEVELKYRLYHFPEPSIHFGLDGFWARIRLFMSNSEHVLLFYNNEALPDYIPLKEINHIKKDIIGTIGQRLKNHNIFLFGYGG